MGKYHAAALLALTCFCADACEDRTRIIVDTDIGDDIDDTWALSALLASSKVDVRLLVADSYSSERRAQVLSRFIARSGAPALPIAIGPQRTGKDLVLQDWAGPEDLQRYKGAVYNDAATAIVDEVALGADARCPTALVVLSPCAAVAAALRQAPWIAQHVTVYAMGGSVWHGDNGTGPPYAEWNIFSDVRSAQAMYTAPWDLTTAPLDTAGAAQVSGTAFASLLACRSQSTLVSALLEMYAAWLPLCPWPAARNGPLGPADLTSTSSVVFDALAAMLLDVWNPSRFVEFRTVRIRVAANGRTLVDPDRGVPITAAIKWRNRDLWEQLFVDEVCHSKSDALLV